LGPCGLKPRGLKSSYLQNGVEGEPWDSPGKNKSGRVAIMKKGVTGET